MRQLLLIALGATLTLAVGIIPWLAVPGCQTNHLFVMGHADPNDLVSVRFGDQTVWSGSPRSGALVDFVLHSQGSGFTVTTSVGSVVQVGYVEPLDGWQHIIDFDGARVGYSTFYRGILSHARDHMSCLVARRFS